MSRLVLPLKRLIVLLLGLGLVWFVVFNFYPLLDDRLPVAIALLITYCFLAYIALPALIRIWHLLQKPTHVPTRTVARDGWALDPINIVILAKNEAEFIRAMQKAGWLTADKKTMATTFRTILMVLLNQPYPNAPFGTQFLFGRRQDLGFQIPIGNSPRNRHHARFWRLGTTLIDEEHEHHGFWRNLLKRFLHKEKEIWVGAAVIDWGINIRVRNLQIDHGIDSDTSLERDYLVATLKDAGVLKDYLDIKAGEPLHTNHQGFRETIIADGYVKLCELKRQFLPPVIKK